MKETWSYTVVKIASLYELMPWKCIQHLIHHFNTSFDWRTYGAVSVIISFLAQLSLFISLLSAAFVCECVRGSGLAEAGKQVGEGS